MIIEMTIETTTGTTTGIPASRQKCATSSQSTCSVMRHDRSLTAVVVDVGCPESMLALDSVFQSSRRSSCRKTHSRKHGTREGRWVLFRKERLQLTCSPSHDVISSSSYYDSFWSPNLVVLNYFVVAILRPCNPWLTLWSWYGALRMVHLSRSPNFTLWSWYGALRNALSFSIAELHLVVMLLRSANASSNLIFMNKT